MQFSTIVSGLAFAAAASAVSVSYDQGYDDAGRSLAVTSCSDGPNGLITRYGWQTQGQVAGFSNIGGSDSIASWNSPNCGKCYRLSYGANSINVLAIDRASPGFNIALGAMDRLTNGQGVALGRIEATATEVALSDCGL